MGRLFTQYLDDEKSNIVFCNKCKVHLIEKHFINHIIGLEISMTHKLPVNVYTVPNDHIVAYNVRDYKFQDIVCNSCNSDIGWTIEFDTDHGYKELVFLQNESISVNNNNVN